MYLRAVISNFATTIHVIDTKKRKTLCGREVHDLWGTDFLHTCKTCKKILKKEGVELESIPSSGYINEWEY